MKTFPPLLIAVALLLTGCASTEPTPVASTPVTTSVTQAPEESSEQVTQETEAAVDSGVVAEPDTQEEPASSPEPAESTSLAPKPSATRTSAPKPTASETPSPTPTQTSAPIGYTKAHVAGKNSRSACWVVVSGSVYNLTDWITKHPGGASAITSLCGGDATNAFEGKHGGEARPSSILESYYLGPLVD